MRVSSRLPRARLAIHLAGLCAILVLTFGGLLSALAYVRLDATSRAASTVAFVTTAESVNRVIAGGRLVIKGALAFIGESYFARTSSHDVRLGHIATLIELLGANVAVTAGYVGYPDGSYLYARRVASDRARRLLGAPAGTAYLVRDLDRSHGALRARQLFLNHTLAVLGSRPETADLIDPRTRPWFVAAREHELHIEQPSRLGSSGGFGFILSVRGPARSVAAVSVGLLDLSAGLQVAATTPGTRIALLHRTSVLALSQPAALAAALSGHQLPQLNALHEPVLIAAYNAIPAGQTSAAGSLKMPDGTTLLYRSIPSGPSDGQRSLLVVIPERELGGAYRAIRNQTIALSMILLALALPLTWWIGRLIARPLVQLASEADALNELDFSDRPVPSSIVFEIDHLAAAFRHMRSRLARFKEVSEALGLENDLAAILGQTLSEIVASIGAEVGVAYLPDADGTLHPVAAHGLAEIPRGTLPRNGVAGRAATAREPLQRRLDARDAALGDAFAALGEDVDLRSLALPFLNRDGDLVALVLVARRTDPERPYSESAVTYARSFAGLTALALETKRYRDDLERYNDAAGHFVPTALLAQMEVTDITAVRLAEYRTRTMAVLSSDIRSFTTISEELGASRTFEFLNRYLSGAAARIRAAGGFVDLYIGDAIVALFPNDPGEAVIAAIELQSEVRAFNADRPTWFERTLQTGVGIDAGEVLLGTIGEPERYTTATISKATGRADAIESRTVLYGAPILISEAVAQALEPQRFQLRRLPREVPENGDDALALFEVCDADEPAVREAKRASAADFADAVALAEAGRFAEAAAAFAAIARATPGDVPAARLRDRLVKDPLLH